MSRRYQNGCLYREKRKTGPDVWVYRWREGQVNRKEKLGTVEQLPSQKAAMKACETLRINANRDTNRSPQTVEELVAHYRRKEMSDDSNKAFSTRTAYDVYLRNWIVPAWGNFALSAVKTVAVEEWLKTLPLANGSRGED